MASASERRAAEGAEHMKKGIKLSGTSLFRWKPDWEGAAQEFDDAGAAFRAAAQGVSSSGGGKDQKAKFAVDAAHAFVRAALAFAALDLPHAAATRTEKAAAALQDGEKELQKGKGNEKRSGKGLTVTVPQGAGASGAGAASPVVDEGAPELYERASGWFGEAGNMDQAAEALVKASKALTGGGFDTEHLAEEDVERAIEWVKRAVETFQDEGREAFMNQTYRYALGLTVRHGRLLDAVELLNKQCESFVVLKQLHEMHKAHLSIIVLLLKEDDFVAAEQHFQKAAAEADGFAPSTEGRVAADLLDAVEKRDADALVAVLAKQQFEFLDNQIVRVAASLKGMFGSSSTAADKEDASDDFGDDLS